MNNRILASLAVLLSAGVLTVCAVGTPDWVATHGRSAAYPSARYLTGFGMSTEDRRTPQTEKIAYAKNAAYGDLIASMSVKVSSASILNTFSQVVKGDEQLVDEYKSRVVATSALRLDGVKFQVHTGRRGGPAHALAYLDKARARTHYAEKFAAKMKTLAKLQGEGNEQLAARKVSLARSTYLQCDKVVAEIEEIIMVLELLEGSNPVSEQDLSQILGVKSRSKELWEKIADSLEEAAEQLAMKIALQNPGRGKVQVNALMLEDSYQYSQFSSRFRTIMERQINKHARLSPMLLSELDFTPKSANVSRHRLAANGADFLLSGSYFIKGDLIHFYVRLSTAAGNEIVASANTRMHKKAVGKLEVKPRNFLQALEDHHVFSKNQIVGGGLKLEVWTDNGVDGLVLEEYDEVKLYVRVNKPCYIRFIYHLANGARVVPDKLFMNYHIGEDKVNKVVTLPTTFSVCAPFGSETMQFFASIEEFPGLPLVRKVFDGEVYEVLADSLTKSNVRHRGLKAQKPKSEVTELRIQLTTVAKD